MEELEKKKKKKHDHLLTKLLKFGIFAVIMLAPFFSVASKCIYVAFNKNAKDSWSGSITYSYDVYETKPFTNGMPIASSLPSTLNDIELNKIYKVQLLYGYTYQNSYAYDLNIALKVNNFRRVNTYSIASGNLITSLQLLVYNIETNQNSNANYTGLPAKELADYTNIRYLYFTDIPTSWNSNILSYFSIPNINELPTYKEYSTISQEETSLDNAFEYSINELNNNNLYNWSKQTAIYGAIQTMTSGLGANDVLAMLIAYWSILTAIYIVFDIIIELFTYLTHLISSD